MPLVAASAGGIRGSPAVSLVAPIAGRSVGDRAALGDTGFNRTQVTGRVSEEPSRPVPGPQGVTGPFLGARTKRATALAASVGATCLGAA